MILATIAYFRTNPYDPRTLRYAWLVFIIFIYIIKLERFLLSILFNNFTTSSQPEITLAYRFSVRLIFESLFLNCFQMNAIYRSGLKLTGGIWLLVVI